MPHGIKGSQPPCSYPECPDHSVAGGYCNKHYLAHLKYGVIPHPDYRPRDRWTPLHRFERYANRQGPVPSLCPDRGPCWIWKGHLSADGYAVSTVNARPTRMHRWAYEHFIGPIPNGLGLDHLCMVKACVNPNHLEPVTSRENHRRAEMVRGVGQYATHCKQGHEWTPDNTYLRPTGGRSCRRCAADRALRYAAEKRSRNNG